MADAHTAEHLINSGQCTLAGTLPNGRVVLGIVASGQDGRREGTRTLE
ncbi:MAG: hypothetical protein OXI27_00650 [Thaumarchaeota archaeon]|nr:hypothetical protein [Nitrososphaerota archaeon]